MKYSFRCLVIGCVLGAAQLTFAQPNRIRYNNQDLFLSGANLAWINEVSFAKDIGPCPTDFNSFGEILLQMHEHGGNAARWWLHTNGTMTPAFNGQGFVIGLGDSAIEDLQKALKLAWQREIGIVLCLWSFDMLRVSEDGPVLSEEIRKRNRLLLTNTAYTCAYIEKCLKPMVAALKADSADSAIIAWEIFNEPEHMSREFGKECGDTCAVDTSDTVRVKMEDIQRFINLCAAAIHCVDPSALVTSSAWNFSSLANKRELSFINYYADSSLIDAGGDTNGTLDFYSVHYYAKWGRPLSPFRQHVSHWALKKPIVVAEFPMNDTLGVSKEYLFETLYDSGYAGALPWSWTDTKYSTHDDMLDGMKSMWDNHRADVDVNGISGDWPTVRITSPDSADEFHEGAEVIITAVASDRDGSVDSVEFFAVEFFDLDTTTIGSTSATPYTITWTDIPPGVYTLAAVATDDSGNGRTSKGVPIKIGTPKAVRFEAEEAVNDLKNLKDPTASNGRFLRMKNSGTISWTCSTSTAGTYEIVFGYRLPYEPKIQHLYVNDVLLPDSVFDGVTCFWLKKNLLIPLINGKNVIKMEKWQGWMDLDYLDVPSDCITSVANPFEQAVSFSLQQNYPNPFNPSTTIRFTLPRREHVTLKIFDVLGREVAMLMNSNLSAGNHTVTYTSREIASGLYFYQIRAGKFSQTRKAVLLK